MGLTTEYRNHFLKPDPKRVKFFHLDRDAEGRESIADQENESIPVPKSNDALIDAEALIENAQTVTENCETVTENAQAVTENAQAVTENAQALTEAGSNLTENDQGALTQNDEALTENDQDAVTQTDDSVLTQNDDALTNDQTATSLGLYKHWTKRYLGSFQAEVWATKSGRKMIVFDETVTLKREAPDPAKIFKAKANSTALLDHIIVRVVNSRGQEFARLSETDARMVSVLMDANVCEFRGVCVFAEDMLRTGDLAYMRLDCYVNRTAFTDQIIQSAPPSPSKSKKNSGFDNARETMQERFVRLRQIGMVRLFDRLDLKAIDNSELPTVQTVEDLTSVPDDKPNEDGDDAETDAHAGSELDGLYQNLEPPDTHLDPVDPPSDTFRMQLRPYQKKGLNWMMSKEARESHIDGEIQAMHPLWNAIAWPSQLDHLHVVMDTDDFAFDTATQFYVNLYSGDLSLQFPVMQKTVLGGILADEMGLGKTISTLALVHANKYQPLTVAPRKDLAKHTTLVVAPMSLLSQWESEVLASAQPGAINVQIYYGSTRGANMQRQLCKPNTKDVPNVIITSYGTLIQEHSQLMNFRKRHQDDGQTGLWFDDPEVALYGLYGVEFFRVVLDEGHTIKNRNTKTSRACYDLRAQRRWVLTGTPIVNKLEDLFSIIKFLQVEPWNNFTFWKAFITNPFESAKIVQALAVVQSIMKPLILRRTKVMKQPDGSPLVQLPKKTVTIERVKFSDHEHELYSFIFARIRSAFDSRLRQGTVLKSYSLILSQILRLRQVCCHPLLVSGASTSLDDDLNEEAGELSVSDLLGQDLEDMLAKFKPEHEPDLVAGDEALGRIVQGASHECPICTCDPIPINQQAVSDCWHMSCIGCLMKHIEFQASRNQVPRCHSCRAEISKDRVFRVIRKYSNGTETIMLRKHRGHRQSAKLRALLDSLALIYGSPESSIATKVVIFSQFTSFLDLIQKELELEHYKVVRFDGSLSQQHRAQVMHTFQTTNQAQILLISLKAGGVGLNLVCASRAFLMDPWWSYAVEAQAIDRIHRMGQTEDVTVTRFIVEGSLEERMLKIQERKRFLASTLGGSEEDKRMQRLEDIKMLFEDA